MSHLRRFAPDLVISECHELSGPISAEVAGLPHVTVGVGPRDWLGTRVAPLVEQVNAVRDEVGLQPVDVLPWHYRTRFVTAVPPVLWQDFRNAPPGTILMRQEDAEGVSGSLAPRRSSSSRRRVFATLGTVATGTDIGLRSYPLVLAGLGATDAEVMFTTTTYDPARFGPVPLNVRLERHAAYAECMACDVVVHHGGSGTAVAALSRGLPAVTLPLVGDHRHTARRLAESGAGLTVAPQDAAERLPAALHRMFTEPSFTASARRIAVEMAGYPPANEVLERLRETTMHAASLRGAE